MTQKKQIKLWIWLKQNRREVTVLSLILATAATMRLTRLGFQSEWNDEALSAVIASGTAQQILTNQFHSLHPPGYYLVLHFWRSLFGDTDFVLRLPSALMGIAGVASMYFLGKFLFKKETGLWAAAITALMPFHLFYSQEMRMYSQLFLLSSLAILCQVQLWRNKKNLWWALYLLVALMGLYSHYLFTLIIVALGLFFVLRRWFTAKGPSWKIFFLIHLVMAVLYLPIIFWLKDQLSQSSNYWIQEVNLALFLSVPLSFTVGHFLDFIVLQIGYGFVLIILIITMLQAARSLKQKRPGFFPLLLVLTTYWFPILIIFIVSVSWTPLTLPRLMMVAVPGLYLLIAWGVTVPIEKVVNVILVVLLILVGLLANYNWLFNPRYSKPPTRAAALLLKEKALPQEAIIYTSDSGFRLFWRYAPQLDHHLFLGNNNNPQIRPEVFRMMGGEIITTTNSLTKTFWLVLHQDFDAEMQEEVFHEFNKQYTRLADYNVGGIRMYHYDISPE